MNRSSGRGRERVSCLSDSDFSSLWSSEERKIVSEWDEHNPLSVHVASLHAGLWPDVFATVDVFAIVE